MEEILRESVACKCLFSGPEAQVEHRMKAASLSLFYSFFG